MKRKNTYLTILLLLALAACSPAPQNETASQSGPPTPAASSAPAERIVSLAPNVTEMLYALGLGPRIAGTTTFCNYPEEAKHTPKVGGYYDPNLEALVALKPDLIICYKGSTKAMEFARNRGIPTLAFTVETIEDATQAMLAIGVKTDAEQKARQLTNEISDELHALESVLADFPVRKALFVVGRDAGSLKNLYAAGRKTYLNDIFKLIRIENAMKETSALYPIVDKEQLIVANPDVIIERLNGNERTPEIESAQRAEWSSLSSVEAVKSGRIVFYDDDRVTINGPGIAQSALTLACLVHGLDRRELEDKIKQYHQSQGAAQP